MGISPVSGLQGPRAGSQPDSPVSYSVIALVISVVLLLIYTAGRNWKIRLLVSSRHFASSSSHHRKQKWEDSLLTLLIPFAPLTYFVSVTDLRSSNDHFHYTLLEE